MIDWVYIDDEDWREPDCDGEYCDEYNHSTDCALYGEDYAERE